MEGCVSGCTDLAADGNASEDPDVEAAYFNRIQLPTRGGAMSRRILIGTPVVALALIVLVLQVVQGAQAHAVRHAEMAGGPIMGPMHMISRDAFLGFYDGKKYTYLNTDTSDKAQAAAWHINYSAALKSVKGSPAIYLVEGRAAAGQLAAFGSQVGAPDYSPLWEELVVKWKAGVKPTLLTSDNAILALQKKGKLTVTDTHIILNCPWIKGM
jgi:hypothetical protein